MKHPLVMQCTGPTNATLSLRVIASSTMTASGSSQMTLPCSKSAVDLSVYVGLRPGARSLGRPHLEAHQGKDLRENRTVGSEALQLHLRA